MKLIFLALSFLISMPAAAQYARRIVTQPILPASCSAAAGDVVFLSTGNRGLYRCARPNVWAKLDNLESINVRDFGAVGDGVADDTAAIQNAILQAASAGKFVFIPAGVYAITGLTFPDGASMGLIGEGFNTIGPKSSVLKCVATNTRAINIDFTSAVNNLVLIRNLYIYGINSSEDGSSIGIYAQKVPSLVLEDIYVAGFGGHGIYLYRNWGATLRNVISSANGRAGLVIDRQGNQVKIYGGAFNNNCRGSSAGYAGISITGALNYENLAVAIRDADISLNGTNPWGAAPALAFGLTVGYTHGLVLDNVYMEKNLTYNAYLGVTAESVRVQGGYCQDADFYLDQPTNVLINGLHVSKIDNDCKLTGTGTNIITQNIYLTGGATNNLVSKFPIYTTDGNVLPVSDNTYYLGKNDDDDAAAWRGVILKDTTNGKYYRIEIINGVITATDLTD